MCYTIRLVFLPVLKLALLVAVKCTPTRAMQLLAFLPAVCTSAHTLILSTKTMPCHLYGVFGAFVVSDLCYL
jgi:hypothetical protein